jgi:hypothetical protein
MPAWPLVLCGGNAGLDDITGWRARFPPDRPPRLECVTRPLPPSRFRVSRAPLRSSLRRRAATAPAWTAQVVTVEKALAAYGAPVYVRKQIVHNRHVVEDLEAAGAIFVDELEQVPPGRGSCSPRTGCRRRCTRGPGAGLKTIDATCPLVTKVHQEAKRFAP